MKREPGEPPFRRTRQALGRSGSFEPDERARELPERMPRTPPCPFCESHETEVMNAFGSHASVSTYWCRACRSPFEAIKWREGGEADVKRR